MATSSASTLSSSSQTSYFCYQCEIQITAVNFRDGEAHCAQCGSDFIEKLDSQHESASEPMQTQTTVQPQAVRQDQESARIREAQRHRRRAERGEGAAANAGDSIAEVLGQYIVQLLQAREQLEDAENYTLPVIPPPPHFLLGLPMLSDQNRIRSNPRNYAWGQGGMDSVISQLLDRMGGSGGPPPAEEDKIKALIHFTISQDEVGNELECSVCKDQFKQNDEVCQLPCKHLYHDNCIIPWLKLHDTCPTCRYSLNQGQVVLETETVNN